MADARLRKLENAHGIKWYQRISKPNSVSRFAAKVWYLWPRGEEQPVLPAHCNVLLTCRKARKAGAKRPALQGLPLTQKTLRRCDASGKLLRYLLPRISWFGETVAAQLSCRSKNEQDGRCGQPGVCMPFLPGQEIDVCGQRCLGRQACATGCMARRGYGQNPSVSFLLVISLAPVAFWHGCQSVK